MHSPWVIGAHAAVLDVTAVVCLQSGWLLSPALALRSVIPSLGANPSGALGPQTPALPPRSLPASPCTALDGTAVCLVGAAGPACPLAPYWALTGVGAHLEAARVSLGLGQGAGAVGNLLQEVGQLVLQLLPGQALSSGPGHRVCPEVIAQVPG